METVTIDERITRAMHSESGIGNELYPVNMDWRENLANEIREAIADEREACAKIADENNLAVVIAELIRTRKS